MLFIVSAYLFCFPVQEIPFKPDNEFSVRVDLQFKSRTFDDSNSIRLTETRAEHEKRSNIIDLPYLTLFFKVLETNQDEQRVKIEKDGKVVAANKKFQLNEEFKIEIGFTDDAKDKVSGYKHVLYFLNDNKVIVNQVVIEILENGDYLINGEKRGRI